MKWLLIESRFRGFEDENINPNEYGIDWQGPTPNEDNDSTVIINEVHNILTQNQLNILRAIDVTVCPDIAFVPRPFATTVIPCPPSDVDIC